MAALRSFLKLWHQAVNPVRVPTPTFVVAFVPALPVLIPYALVSHYLDRHRLRTAAGAVSPRCRRKTITGEITSLAGTGPIPARDSAWFALSMRSVRPAVPGCISAKHSARSC